MQRNVTERTEWRMLYTVPASGRPSTVYTGPPESEKELAGPPWGIEGHEVLVGYQKRTVYETPWEDAE